MTCNREPKPLIVLLHSSASGRRQWRALTAVLEDRYRVVTPDLIGYGAAPAWPGDRPQRLADQAALVHAAAGPDESPFALVGHSFGASVALCAAAELGDRLQTLVLLEPNPFSLLRDGGAHEYAEAATLRDTVQTAAGRGTWEQAAERFADYWNGPDTWAGMSDDRRRAFAEALRPNVHEWDAVMDAPAREYVAAVTASTHVVSARDTVATIAALVSLLERMRPDWSFAQVARGGHMAPLSEPGLVNPLVASILDAEAARRTREWLASTATAPPTIRPA